LPIRTGVPSSLDSAYNMGEWNMPGLTSSIARKNSSPNPT
jgi:hypothetical protein